MPSEIWIGRNIVVWYFNQGGIQRGVRCRCVSGDWSKYKTEGNLRLLCIIRFSFRFYLIQYILCPILVFLICFLIRNPNPNESNTSTTSLYYPSMGDWIEIYWSKIRTLTRIRIHWQYFTWKPKKKRNYLDPFQFFTIRST